MRFRLGVLIVNFLPWPKESLKLNINSENCGFRFCVNVFTYTCIHAISELTFFRLRWLQRDISSKVTVSKISLTPLYGYFLNRFMKIVKLLLLHIFWNVDDQIGARFAFISAINPVNYMFQPVFRDLFSYYYIVI